MQLKSQKNAKSNSESTQSKTKNKKKINSIHLIMLSAVPIMAIFIVFGILLTGKNVEISKASGLRSESSSQAEDISRYMAIPPLPSLGSNYTSSSSVSSSIAQEYQRKVTGRVESISCEQISGYAINLINPADLLEVRVYKGRPSYNGGQLVKTLKPDQIREIDGKSGLFGFSMATPQEFQNDSSYLVVEVDENAGYGDVWDAQIIPTVKLLNC